MNPVVLRERVHDRELLDESVHEPADLRRNLAHLAGVSRWLGGERTIVKHALEILKENLTQPFITLLDVGSGGADLAHRLGCRVSRSLKADVRVVALDSLAPAVRIASERFPHSRTVRLLVADGRQIPLPDKSVDVAYSSTTLHHLVTADAVVLVRELARVARTAVIVGDLERHVVALGAAQILAVTWWRRSPYRSDGPLSVRRAFVRSELLEVGTAAGLDKPRVYRNFPFRLTLVGGAV